MLPVTPRTIVLPWSLRLLTPRSRSAECIVVKSRPARYIGMVAGPADGFRFELPGGRVVFPGSSKILRTSLGTEKPCAAVIGTAPARASSDDGRAAKNGPRDIRAHRHVAGGCGGLCPRGCRAAVPSFPLSPPAPLGLPALRLHQPNPGLWFVRRGLPWSPR